MNDELQKTVNLSWDPMHRIEFVFKDSKSVVNSKMFDNTIAVIHETLSLCKTGNNFELLHTEKDVCDTFYMPKTFKDMKFVTYSSEVFKQYIVVLRDNLISWFDCKTFKICRQFQTLFDPSPYLNPSNSHPTDDPFYDFVTDFSFIQKDPNKR